MKPWPPELGVRTVIAHDANARRLRREARCELLVYLFELVTRRLHPVRPRASGDPGPRGKDWMPASAGTNGEKLTQR
jgi:hypothetical protein